MSVYIPNMEMPKNCYQCPSCDKENGKCQVLNDFIFYDRPSWCPLVPLPEWHGRLIDAEAFVDYMQNRYDNNEITNGDWIDFRLSLKDQPTIVPAKGETDNA